MTDFEKNELDIFTEMGSIGSGNAATALSQMINKKVSIKPLKTQIVPIEQVADEIGGAETMVMAVYLRVMGDLTGDAVYLHPTTQAMRIINMINGRDIEERLEPQDDDVSAYKEMSNIFTGSYLNAISSMLDIMMVPSVPHYANDMLGSLIDFILSEVGKTIDSILLIKTEMEINDQAIGGGYLMIFNPDSLQKMREMIRERYGF
ncbi:MAG: chemotaxis protein CheC [Candidatus Woesearchaeota archaeon]